MQPTREHLAALATAATLAFGLALMAWGLLGLRWPEVLPFSADAAERLLLVLSISFLIYLSDKIWRIGAVCSTGFAFFLVCVAIGQPWVPLAVLLFALASVVLGGAILDALRVFGAARGFLIDGLVGAGGYGMAVYLLAGLDLAYPGIYSAILALPLVARWQAVRALARRLTLYMADRRRTRPPTQLLQVAIAAVAFAHLVVAMLPELGSDALAMHLFLGSQLLNRHGWGFDATVYTWAVMPMLGDWIFSYGYLLAGESAARLVNVAFILLLAELIRRMALWAGATPAAARLAVLLFLSMPLTFTVSSSLFVESVWSAFLVGGLLVLSRTDSTPEDHRSHLPLAGLLLGLGLATKAVTLALLPAYLLFMALRARQLVWPLAQRRAPLALALFLGLGAIPYAIAYWQTGNPVFPFFNALFRSPLWPPQNFESASIFFGKGLTPGFFYTATFQSERFIEGTAGTVGFQWVALMPASLAVLVIGWRRRGLALALVAMVGIAAAFQSVSYLRYVIPCFVMLCAALGAGIPSGASAIVWRAMAVAVVGLNLLFFSAAAPYRDFPLNPLLSQDHRDDYLAVRMPERLAVRAANGVNTFATPVAFLAQPYGSGLNAAAVYANWYNTPFFQGVNSAKTKGELVSVLSRFGIELVVLGEEWGNGNSWGTSESRALILQVTDPVATFGPVALRRVDPRLRFATELLESPDFLEREAWTYSEGATWSPGQVLVDNANAAAQTVAVREGWRYVYEAALHCPEALGSARLQVNWQDGRGKLLAASIRVVACHATDASYSMDLQAPEGAAYAAVYVSGHSKQPVIFTWSSLKQ